MTLTDVEVAGGVAESVLSLADGATVSSKNCTGQGEAATGLVDLLKGIGPLGIGVNVDSKDWSENLLIEELVLR